MRTLRLAAVLAAGALLGGPATAVAGAQNSCAALGGTVADGICHVSASKPAYVMDLQFPTDYPDEQAIVDYLTQNRDGFVNVAQPGSRNHAVRNGRHGTDIQLRADPERGAQDLPGRRGSAPDHVVQGRSPTTWASASR